MADTKIEWATKTWNPITGCTKISAGCQNCYAERMSKRLAGRYGYDKDNPFQVTFHADRLDEPLKWRKPQMVFVCSMGDLFHEDVPEMAIVDCLSVMAEACQHTFLILTKRPERMRDMFCHKTISNDVWLQTTRGVDDMPSPWPLPNVWLGVTAENQEMANERIPILLQIPAAKRFVSVEPMLGAVDLEDWFESCQFCNACGSVLLETDDTSCRRCGDIRTRPGRNGLDWIICGGETSLGARPMHPDWARDLRDQCVEAGVPFFFKQWGEWAAEVERIKVGDICISEDGLADVVTKNYVCLANESDGTWMRKVGRKNTGRLLDGREWNERPEV